jgi:hypothetical protein
MLSSLRPTAPPFYPSSDTNNNFGYGYHNNPNTFVMDICNGSLFSVRESAYDHYAIRQPDYNYGVQYPYPYHNSHHPLYVYPNVLDNYHGVEYFYSHSPPSPVDVSPPAYGAWENRGVGELGFQEHGWKEEGQQGYKKGKHYKKNKAKARKMWKRKEGVEEERGRTLVRRGEEGFGAKVPQWEY